MHDASPVLRSCLAFVLAPLVPVAGYVAYAVATYGASGAVSADGRPFLGAALLLAYTSALVFAVPAYVACARHGKTTPAASVAVGTLCTLPTAALIALVSHGVTASSPGAAPYAQLAQSMMAGAVVLPWGALSGAVVWALRFRMAR